jgi:hypothetical protein
MIQKRRGEGKQERREELVRMDLDGCCLKCDDMIMLSGTGYSGC